MVKNLRKETGYEVCNHTCTTSPCVSRATGTPLWNREGNSLTRHAANNNLHPDCTPDCPACGDRAIKILVRDATLAELARYDPTRAPDPGPADVPSNATVLSTNNKDLLILKNANRKVLVPHPRTYAVRHLFLPRNEPHC
jgi:hypothetical protein